MMELVVAASMLSVVLMVVGSIFISVITTQSTVSAVTTSSTAGQLAARSIETGVRNASEYQLVAVGSDQLLVARTAGTESALSWSCVAWFYDADDGGSIRMTRTADGTAIAAPDAAELADWTLLADGISPRDGAPGIFSSTPPLLAVAFDATADDHAATVIEFTATPLTQSTEAATCF